MAASSVIGALRVNLALDSAQFQQGAVRAQRQMVGLQTSTQNLQRAANGFNFRMLLPQLSQVAQQTTATGRPMQALAVQAADIGMAFGPMGIAIGAVAGLVLPQLIASFGGGATAAERFADASKTADSALGELNSTIGSISSLERDYREAVESGNTTLAARIALLIELRNAEAEYQLLELPERLREQEAALADLTEQQRDQAEVLAEAARAAQDALAGGDRSQINIAQLGLDEAREAYNQIANAAALARNQTEQLRLQIDIAKSSLETASDSAQGVVAAMAQTATNTAAAALEAMGLDSAMSQAQVRMSGAAGAAWGIYNALVASVGQALALARAQSAAAAAADTANFVGDPNDDRGSQSEARQYLANQRAQESLRLANETAAAYRGVAQAAGSSPGGAAGAVQELASVSDTLDDILRGAADPIQDARDAMQGIADDGIGALGDALGEFAESGFSDFTSLMDGMVDAASDAVADITAQFASRQLASALGSFAGPVGGLLGGVAGGLFGGLFGGGGGKPYEETEQYDIDQEKAGLIREIRELEGQTNVLRRQEIAALDESNQALGRRLQRLQEEADVAAEREGLQQRLLQAQGREGELRRLELAQLDPSNRAILRRIWAIERETAAADRAAQREETRQAELLARAEAFKSERQGLERQLYTVLGDTASLRAMELAELDPGNRALQQHIWALEDEKKAADEAASAAERLASSLSTDQFASLFDYERAVGLARYGSMAPANSSVPPVPAPVAALSGGSASGSPAANTEALLAGILNRITTVEKITRKWDRDGLPEERIVA